MGSMSMLLFSRPSFIGGVSQIVDIGDTLNEYNRSLTGEQADYLALSADWLQVGTDMQGAMDAVGRDVETNALVQEVEEEQ